MGGVSHLRVTSSTRSSPDYDGLEIAWARYSAPIGWMFLFASQDFIHFTDPENPGVGLSYYRSSLGPAMTRLQHAIKMLRTSSYLWSCFRALEAVVEILGRHQQPYVELEYNEMIYMGVGRFGKRIKVAALLLEQSVKALEARTFGRARSKINKLSPLCGLKLHGFRFLDHAWWWLDRKVLGLATDDELCKWWSIGVLGSSDDPDGALKTAMPLSG